ncbi:nucleotidyltransferase [Cellulomonas iranensis]|uniref:nucleotidyltransferase n=1 Tax=Cellulomonas iranensis TaxID=76862 RepID=UPI001CF1B9C3|nr:nucleotidyltransferase [Cellulomonas iranensis]UCN14443.1 nucleotidyltransferase [Cellulomonas iranensis]
MNSAFEDFRKTVDASLEDVAEARRRRGLFRDALLAYDDIMEIVPSGAIARGTHKHPIHDVDLIAIYRDDDHIDWGQPGTSADDALEETGSRINEQLGMTHGLLDQQVRLASPRNHAVKCFLDDPDDPGAFTVDVVPAFRRDGMLLIPQSATATWIPSNPEYLIKQVAKRHAEWDKFASSVRMLKAWGAGQDTKIKSLVMEVLALEHLPVANNRPTAIAQFFSSAAWHLENGGTVEDPAKVCGEIQADLDSDAVADLLRLAADTATRALQAVRNNDPHRAISLWGEVFGPDFPAPTGLNPAAAVVATPRPVKDTPQG